MTRALAAPAPLVVMAQVSSAAGTGGAAASSSSQARAEMPGVKVKLCFGSWECRLGVSELEAVRQPSRAKAKGQVQGL